MAEKLYLEVKGGGIIPLFPKSKLVDGKYALSEVKAIRSLKQNNMYWGYILKFIILQYREFWYIYTKDNLHEIFWKAFLPRVRIKSDFTKSYVMQVESTTKLTTKQFSDYIERIKAIFEFWYMEKLKMEKIDPFVIPEIKNEDELLYRQNLII